MSIKYFFLLTFLVVLVMVPILGANLSISAYTIDDVLSFYESGNFSAIETNSTIMLSSRDGRYVLAGGLYRVSDGMFWEQFDNAYFSSDGQYLLQISEGVYQVYNQQLVVPIQYEKLSNENGTVIGNAEFTNDSQYVAISGAGIYREQAINQSTDGYGIFRLSDGQRVIASDSLFIELSTNSAYASTDDGIYSLNSGERLFDMEGISGFSPNSLFVYNNIIGVMRISDGSQVVPPVNAHIVFSPDVTSVLIPELGMYRLDDGQLLFALDHESVFGRPPTFTYDGNYVAIDIMIQDTDSYSHTVIYEVETGREILSIAMDRFSPGGEYVISQGDGIYALSNQQKIFDFGGLYVDVLFSPDDEYVYLSSSGVYSVADQQNIINIGDSVNSIVFSDDSQLVAVEGFGLYNLSDGRKLFDLEGYIRDFTDDSAYLQVGLNISDAEVGIYRLSDGHKFHGLQFLNAECGLLQSQNFIIVVSVESIC